MLVEDLDLESPAAINALPAIADADIEGVDIIASAVLEGARILDGKALAEVRVHFEQLLWLLRQ